MSGRPADRPQVWVWNVPITPTLSSPALSTRAFNRHHGQAHREPQDLRSRAPRHDHAAPLRPLDAAGAPRRGQRGDPRVSQGAGVSGIHMPPTVAAFPYDHQGKWDLSLRRLRGLRGLRQILANEFLSAGVSSPSGALDRARSNAEERPVNGAFRPVVRPNLNGRNGSSPARQTPIQAGHQRARMREYLEPRYG